MPPRLFSFSLLFVLTIGISIGYAQNASISGIILDRSSDDPLPGVNVVIDGTLSGTMTGTQGEFVMSGLHAGPLMLVFSSVGFSNATAELVLVEDSVTTVVVYLDPVFLRLPNVEVVGERSIAERMTPASFNRIESKDLELTRPLGTEEVLRSVPGVHIASDDGISNRVNIGIRGVYPRRSEKILLLEDGVPIQPALYLAPSAYYNPPAERLDAIEVIKNASNVQFGAGSLVGTINYVTRRPPVSPGGTVSITGGSHAYFSSLVAYGGSNADGNLGGELQLLYKRGDGFRENTGFDIYNATGKILYKPAETTTLSFKGNLHREDAQATYSALTPYMFARDPAQNPFEYDWLETGRIAGDMNLEQVLGENLVLLVTAYGNQFRRDWWRQGSVVVDAVDLEPDAPEDAMIRVGQPNNRARLRQFKVYGLSPKLVGQATTHGLRHTLEFGIRVHRDEFDNVEIDTDRPNSRVDDFDAASFGDPSDPAGSKRTKQRFTADALAFYAQDRLTVGPVGITGGIRLETYRQFRTDFYDRSSQRLTESTTSVSSTEILPSFGFAVPTRAGTLFGGVFRGFVPLTSSFAFASLVDDEGFLVSDRLEPEHSLNFEIGYRSTTGGAVEGSAAVFHNTVSGLVAAGRNASFRPVVGNLGEVRYAGIELDVRVGVDPSVSVPVSLTIDGQVTYLDSKITQGLIDEQGASSGIDITGNEAPYAPALIARFGLTASSGVFDFSIHYNRVDEQFADFNNTYEETAAGDNGLLPAYHFVDLGARFRLPAWPVTATVAVKNATNDVYRGSRLHRSSSGIFPGGFRQINFGIEVGL